MKKNVSFKNRTFEMAADIYFPPEFKENKKYPAIVVTHPGGGVKEQVAGLYAEKLSERGFITLAFDASHQGQSGGEPRYLEDPACRVDDIRYAIDYLDSLPYVDDKNIGALGICAGGGYTINATQTEYRIKAAATVSAADFGTLIRCGIGNTTPSEDLHKMLSEVAKQRTKEAQGAEPKYIGIVPSSPAEINDKTPVLFKEGYEYYCTPRGYNPHAPNKMSFISYEYLAEFKAFELVETISPRPILMIAGTKADTLYFSEIAVAKAKEPKELYLVDGATHVDMYDKPQYVEPAVAKLEEFFKKYLK